jgi:hypothetical protein
MNSYITLTRPTSALDLKRMELNAAYQEWRTASDESALAQQHMLDAQQRHAALVAVVRAEEDIERRSRP